MSEAMTNSEIEDVLTSIRRLVAQEQRHASANAPAPSGRLVLTPAQRIDTPAEEGAVAPPHEPAADAGQPAAADQVQADTPPTTSTDSADPAPKDAAQDAAANTASPLSPPPDFRRLEATIAELEAAVSASGSVFEPDCGDAGPGARRTEPSNVTALYAKPSFIHNPPAESAAISTQTTETQAAQTALPAADNAAEVDPADEDDGDPIETVIDEATLRSLVAQIVREELHGQLGERITLQVRKLVRSEIAKALDSRNLL
ncbi:MAG: hypothetical protein HLUCCA12_01755 [Rhodobacteraceae bacterium HLUCCA12]|nr:MAG: hypothetical protein HLUCCA12_01755 [Rhodobacteraceae bacterium HLUCCA12]